MTESDPVTEHITALEDYLQHKPTCRINAPNTDSPCYGDCTCGLSMKLLEAYTEAKRAMQSLTQLRHSHRRTGSAPSMADPIGEPFYDDDHKEPRS